MVWWACFEFILYHSLPQVLLSIGLSETLLGLAGLGLRADESRWRWLGVVLKENRSER